MKGIRFARAFWYCQTPCKSLSHHQPIQVHGKCFSGLCSRTSHLGINGTEGFTAVVGTEVRDRKNPGWRLRAGSAEGARSAQGFWEERTQKRGWWQVLGWGINPSMNWLGWAGGGLTPLLSRCFHTEKLPGSAWGGAPPWMSSVGEQVPPEGLVPQEWVLLALWASLGRFPQVCSILLNSIPVPTERKSHHSSGEENQQNQ